jgi:hypothetical protein
MNSEAARARAEVVDEVSKWGVGGGIILVALFPLALPILILTGIALLPLLVPLLALGLLAGPVVLAFLLVRRIGRTASRIRIRRRPATRAEPSPRPATPR